MAICCLRLILLAILNARFDDFLALFGLVCASYVTISKGSHWWCPSFPLGLDSSEFVRHGNEFTSKTLSLIQGVDIHVIWYRPQSFLHNINNEIWFGELPILLERICGPIFNIHYQHIYVETKLLVECWEKPVAHPLYWFFWNTTKDNQRCKWFGGSHGGSCFSFRITCDGWPHF